MTKNQPPKGFSSGKRQAGSPATRKAAASGSKKPVTKLVRKGKLSDLVMLTNEKLTNISGKKPVIVRGVWGGVPFRTSKTPLTPKEAEWEIQKGEASGWPVQTFSQPLQASPVSPQKPSKKKPVFGAYKGKFEVGPEFFEPLPDEELKAWGEV